MGAMVGAMGVLESPRGKTGQISLPTGSKGSEGRLEERCLNNAAYLALKGCLWLLPSVW